MHCSSNDLGFILSSVHGLLQVPLSSLCLSFPPEQTSDHGFDNLDKALGSLQSNSHLKACGVNWKWRAEHWEPGAGNLPEMRAAGQPPQRQSRGPVPEAPSKRLWLSCGLRGQDETEPTTPPSLHLSCLGGGLLSYELFRPRQTQTPCCNQSSADAGGAWLLHTAQLSERCWEEMASQERSMTCSLTPQKIPASLAAKNPDVAPSSTGNRSGGSAHWRELRSEASFPARPWQDGSL